MCPLRYNVGLNVNVTNRIDANGNPMGITVIPSANVFTGAAAFYSALTIQVTSGLLHGSVFSDSDHCPRFREFARPRRQWQTVLPLFL